MALREAIFNRWAARGAPAGRKLGPEFAGTRTEELAREAETHKRSGSDVRLFSLGKLLERRARGAGPPPTPPAPPRARSDRAEQERIFGVRRGG